jgi:hypothetical protein
MVCQGFQGKPYTVVLISYVSLLNLTLYLLRVSYKSILFFLNFIQNAPGEDINILGGHSIGHSKQKIIYVHVSYSERFPR